MTMEVEREQERSLIISHVKPRLQSQVSCARGYYGTRVELAKNKTRIKTRRRTHRTKVDETRRRNAEMCSGACLICVASVVACEPALVLLTRIPTAMAELLRNKA